MCAACPPSCFPVNQHRRSNTFIHTLSVRLLPVSAVCGHMYLKQHAHCDYRFSSPLPPAILLTKAWLTPPLCSIHISGKTVLKGSDKWDHSSSIPLFLNLLHAYRSSSGFYWCPKLCTLYGNGWHPSTGTMRSSRFTTVHCSYLVATVTRKGDGKVGSEKAPRNIFGHMCDFPFLVWVIVHII